MIPRCQAWPATLARREPVGSVEQSGLPRTLRGSRSLVAKWAPITVDLATLTDGEEVYSARTSIFFKRTHVYRVLDKKRNTLVYLAISDKLIDGSPQNAISTVPIMPWGTGR